MTCYESVNKSINGGVWRLQPDPRSFHLLFVSAGIRIQGCRWPCKTWGPVSVSKFKSAGGNEDVKIIKQKKKCEIEKWEIAFGVKIKCASLRRQWNSHAQLPFSLKFMWVIVDMIQFFKHGMPNKGFLFLSGFSCILRAYSPFADYWKVSQELCNFVLHKFLRTIVNMGR